MSKEWKRRLNVVQSALRWSFKDLTNNEWELNKTLWSALTSLQFSFCPKYFRFKLSTLWVHYSSGSSWRFWGKVSHVLWLLSREVVDSTSFPFSFPSSSHVSYLDHTLIFTPQGIQDFFKVAASNSIFLIKNVCWIWMAS